MALAPALRSARQAGLVCRIGTLLIVDAENGEHETHRHVHALDLPGSVEIYQSRDGKRFDLLRRDFVDLDWLLAHNPGLLILASLRTMLTGEENHSGAVATVLGPLRNLVREHKAGRILLHYSGQEQRRLPWARRQSARARSLASRWIARRRRRLAPSLLDVLEMPARAESGQGAPAPQRRGGIILIDGEVCRPTPSGRPGRRREGSRRVLDPRALPRREFCLRATPSTAWTARATASMR